MTSAISCLSFTVLLADPVLRRRSRQAVSSQL
jgi:hypothetical protein